MSVLALGDELGDKATFRTGGHGGQRGHAPEGPTIARPSCLIGVRART